MITNLPINYHQNPLNGSGRVVLTRHKMDRHNTTQGGQTLQDTSWINIMRHMVDRHITTQGRYITRYMANRYYKTQGG